MLSPEEVSDTTKTVIDKDLAMFEPQSMADLLHQLTSGIVKLAINIVVAALVFYAGRYIIKRLTHLTSTIMTRRDVDASLASFILSLVKIVLYFILIVTVIGILGLETSSFLALFASAGVAIGMALSGTLQNFAGGVLILLLKPYRVGDYIEAQGYSGTVKEIQIFSTLILTPDHKTVIIPNGPLSTSSINNWSREGYRRIDWSVGISYGDDVDSARKAILDMFAADPRIVQGTICDHRRALQPEADAKPDAACPPTDTADVSPVVLVSDLADSAVVLQVRAWAPVAEYWNVYFGYYERFYKELPSHGVNFPFPQLDVHFDKA